MAQILVIEDDDLLRDMIQLNLEHVGHLVVAARNGAEGMQAFRHRPAELVLTDMVMPKKDGIETVIALRQEFPEVPVIAMSGLSKHSPVYLSLASRLGARRVLAKPFTIPDLLQAITEVLGANSTREPF